MSPNKRNFIVGLVVLIALGILTWMLLLFAGKTTSLFVPAGIKITLEADRADGVSDGTQILYRGVSVGKVDSVQRDLQRPVVLIRAEVDKIPPLPGNVVGMIRAQSALGPSASIYLESDDSLPAHPMQSNETIKTKYIGYQLIPDQFTKLADDIRREEVARHLDEALDRIATVMDSVQKVVGNPRTREDIQASIASIRTAADSASRIGASLEKFTQDLQKLSAQTSATIGDVRTTVQNTDRRVADLSKQLGDNVQKVGAVVDRFDSIAAKIDKGTGTASLLVNDPKLYESLVDTAHELNTTVATLQRLAQQWEQEGVSLKLR